MSPPAVNTMPRTSILDAPSSDLVSLRNFVVDEDAANFSTTLWKSIDKNAFVLAQRDAIEAFNIAKALRLSEETAALEQQHRRNAVAVPDEAAARSLARSWQVDALQPALLGGAARPKTSSGSSSASASAYQNDSKKASIANLSLSTVPANAVPSSSASQSHSRTHSYSQSQQSRPVLKRDPATVDALSTSPPRPQPTRATTSFPASSSASAQAAALDVSGSPKRQRDRKASVSSFHYSTGHGLPYTSSNTTGVAQASVQASMMLVHLPEPKKSVQKEKETSPSVSTAPLPSSSASAQAQVQAAPAPVPAAAPTPAPAPEKRSRRRSSAVQLPQQRPRDIFAPPRFNCTKCGSLVSSSPRPQPSLNSPDPFAHPSTSLLHISCLNCGTTHCRGCLSAVRCPASSAFSSASSSPSHSPSSSTSSSYSPSSSPPTSSSSSPNASVSARHPNPPSSTACTGSAGCALWGCCRAVRAIAVWEALREFDWVFGVEAGGDAPGQGQGQRATRQQRDAYIKLLISKADKSMRRFEDAFVRTLRVLCSWLQPPHPAQDPEKEEEHHQRAHESLLSHLFTSSHILEVVYAFLSNTNVRDWIAHSETYLVVLEVLRRMGDAGLGRVLSAGVGVGVGDAAAAAGTAQTSSLCDLVKQLEAHRRPLMALAAKVQFSATVDKVNNLCDAISYLLLQLVVGGF